MTHDFQIIAIRIQNVGCIIMVVVMAAYPRRAIIFTASPYGGRPELVYGGALLSRKDHMHWRNRRSRIVQPKTWIPIGSKSMAKSSRAVMG
ncbi:hypothetical protein BK025_01115 [Sodalis sp. TME1]|nr:hypothetical protein BK025_01115 [Sodalis sp. TME1]